jgi:hypothetical protein
VTGFADPYRLKPQNVWISDSEFVNLKSVVSIRVLLTNVALVSLKHNARYVYTAQHSLRLHSITLATSTKHNTRYVYKA